MPAGFGPIGSRPIGGKQRLSNSYTRTLAYLSTTTAAITKNKSLGKILKYASTTAASVQRATSRTLNTLRTTVGSIVNNFGHVRTLTAHSVTTNSLSKAQTLFRTLSYASTTVGALGRTIAWVLTLTARPSYTGYVSRRQALVRTLSAVSTSVGLMARGALGHFKTLLATSTSVGAISHRMNFARTLKYASTTASKVTKAIGSTQLYAMTTVAVFINSRYRYYTFKYKMTTQPRLKKHVFPGAKKYVSTMVPKIVKRTGKVLRYLVSHVAVFPGYTRQYQRKLAYTSNTISKVIKGVFKGPLLKLVTTLSNIDFAMGGFHFLTLKAVSTSTPTLQKNIAATKLYVTTTISQAASTVVHAIRRHIQLYL
jgi:hypothetical protein